MKFCMPTDLERTNNFFWENFCEKKNYKRGGRLIVEIHICFMEMTHQPLLLRQINFSIVKDCVHTDKFYLNH
jgi:hypothetical protein